MEQLPVCSNYGILRLFRRKVLSMKNVTLPSLLLVCSMVAAAQQSGQQDSKKGIAPPAVCDAATPKLRETGTNEIVLTMVVDIRGRVESFKTESPKGLRLEKMKDAAAAVKAMQFKPVKKDGRPVTAIVRFEFDCSGPVTDASKKP